MLCCVSRKASSARPNHRGQQKHEKPADSTDCSGSSSGFSESSSASSGDFASSGFSAATSSSSSSTSGFSSASPPSLGAFANSTSDSSSFASGFCDRFDVPPDYLVDRSSATPGFDVRGNAAVSSSSSSSSAKGSPPVPPKRLQTFAPSTSALNRSNAGNSVALVENEQFVEDEPPVLLPCAICARTFMPQSLEKHTRICERSAIKKRKPFDSAKQRIQGTDLAEFLPKETTRRKVHQEPEKPLAAAATSKGAWKQTHDEFLRAVRAARGETIDSPPQRQNVVPSSHVTVGVPTRPNEKGMCPTCNRQFSIKAYERHVAWCKEHATRVPISPATNVAKERLEARMRYRAPLLKNRRITNREKYSPGSATNLPSYAGKNSPASSRPKESASTPSCNNNKGGNEAGTPGGGGAQSHQKASTNAGRSGQGREGTSTRPMKSRLSDRSSRSSDRESRAVWSNYVRRRPDFNLVLTGRTGSFKDYDPFLLAERQMNELLSDTCSDQSFTDSPSNRRRSSSPPTTNYPLSHSSAFVKYPDPVTRNHPDKRASLIAPPSEFDDLTGDFSSDSTETNSISREMLADLEDSRARENGFGHESKGKDSRDHVLGRRVIIDKSKALGTSEMIEDSGHKNSQSNEKARKILDKITPKVVRPHVTRSSSVRSNSAPKVPERKSNNNSSLTSTNKINSRSSPGSGLNNRNNNYTSLSGSNMSLSSIVSSEVEVKRSNSLFDELASSFEDDASGTFPSLRSLLKNDSLSVSSPVQTNRPRNGQISDEELSSPDSYQRQDHNKLSADSAYSSLNRKYSNHGRSTNDMAGRLEGDSPQRRRDGDAGSTCSAKSKMSKFCHECGCKFPEVAKFCCECGIRRLAL